ncbi:MAG: GGDEF domain-containing protein [Candidatus Omnitrophica bacterium]|nr:GGDEF domain-containing protein [Candidatus Omnitrophota bacterium]
MAQRARLRRAFLIHRRYRQILIAAAATLIISLALLGLITFSRWRSQSALQRDTQSVISQTSQQLIRALQSRRGTLTLIADTLNRRSDLSLPQLRALGQSAVEHTRHLLGTGLVQQAQPPAWWVGPSSLAAQEKLALNRAIQNWSRMRGVWRVASTFTTTVTSGRIFIVMMEPLRTRDLGNAAVVGAFDTKPLLDDFFTSNLSIRYPVRILENGSVLYQSASWIATSTPLLIERPLAIDALRWILQMQSPSTHVVRTLSSFYTLLIILSLMAGIGTIAIIWLLATRAWVLQRAVDRRTSALRKVTQRLRTLAITDELTGLHNRRFFLERLKWEYKRSKRYQRPLACLMIDVDRFKQVNDRFGHAAGDLVLKQVARELKALLRQSDILARLGGDEFAIALPETSTEQASSVAEKLRRIQISIADGKQEGIPSISLSVGVGSAEESPDPEKTLEAADQALYAHKQRRYTSSTIDKKQI